LKRGRS